MISYNEAVRESSDKELLLNIVRVRYFDTIEFISINSISAQLSFSVSVGGVAGRETSLNTDLGMGEISWSNRPTFTFTPQRGPQFAKMMIASIPMPILIDLVSADWDIRVLFRLMVQNMNGLANVSGIRSQEFMEITDLMSELQIRGDIYFGTITEPEVLSDPIAASRVSGSDLVEAAKAGYRFERDTSGSEFILTQMQNQPVMYIPHEAAERKRLFNLLQLHTDHDDFIEIMPGVKTEDESVLTDNIMLDTRSAIDTIAFLATGVEVPAPHINRGWAMQDWPVPGIKSSGLQGLFQIHSSDSRPESSLAVKYRDHWFYIEDGDMESRLTFQILAEIVRLALSPSEGQTPVLTLPLGG